MWSDGIVADGRDGVDAIFHSGKSAQPEVIALVFVGKHLTSQKWRIFSILVQVHLEAAVDLEIGLLPSLVGGIPIDEGTIKQLVAGIECNQAIVALNGTVVADVAVVDIARVKRSTEAEVIMPFVLCLGAHYTESQQHKQRKPQLVHFLSFRCR